MSSPTCRVTSGRRIRRIAALLLTASAAAVVGVGGAKLGLLSPRPSSRAVVFGPISVQPDALDFGTVLAQRDFQWAIPVTNTSDRPVDVIDVIPSCGCAVADRRSFSVVPGETAAIKLSIDLTSKRQLVAGPVQRLFPVSVMLLTKTENAGQIKLDLRGVVKDSFYLTAPAIVFSDVWEDTEDLPVAHLMAMPLVPLAKLSARCDDELQVVVGTPHRQQNVKDGTAEPGFPIKVALKKRLPCGNHALNTTLFATTAEGEELPGLRVPVKVTVVGDVFVSPAFNHLGPIRCGSEESTSFQLISRSGSPFRITSVGVAVSEGFRVTVDSEAPAQPAHRLSLACSVSESGKRSVPVTIDWEKLGGTATERTGGRSGTLSLQFTYVGLP